MASVINRKRNRTINQDIAQHAPKWEDMGGGILKLKGENSFIKRGKGNRWESMRKPPMPVQEQAA